ncbi:MAG: hypothetical protein GC192_20060 [Bacteroidetes bacterium]|nr:hypothetical protein [Bacteroidota bacterium]
MKTVLLAFVTTCLGFYYLPKTDLVITKTEELDFSADPELATTYKAKVIQGVFKKLKNAKGDLFSRRPHLRFVKETGSGVAVAYPKIGLIMLEEKGYDICTSFGKDSLNAMAVFLSHELVHCYEHHDWEEYFASEFKGNGLGNAVKDDAKEDEIQADYLGGFLSYQAGFNPFGIMPKFLDKVYDQYNLTDAKLSKYPKKEERKNISVESEEKLKKLLKIFEMGNYLAVLEEYDDALEYYYKVLEDFQSREIYNNLGVLSTLAAMKKFTPKENTFLYPVELDVQSRLRPGTKDGDLEKEYREEKLTEAIGFFEKARQFDNFYPIAYLNEGCAHALLGISQTEYSDLEWADAESAAQHAIRLAGDNPEWKPTLANSKVLLGILSALNKDSLSANQFFKEALQLDSSHFLAKTNQNILNDIKNPRGGIKKLNLSAEQIETARFVLNKVTDKKADIVAEPDFTIEFLAKEFAESTALGNSSTKGTGGNRRKLDTTIRLTSSDYKQASAKDIILGNNRQQVEEKYGEPFAFISLGNGSFLRYLDQNPNPVSGLIFQFNEENELVQWCKYWQIR